VISLEGVTYTYPDTAQPVLRDVSLHLPAGSLTLVAGPSGSGKSTLLRCLNGLVPHFTGGTLVGRLRVAGLDPVRATPAAMSRRVAFVFQEPAAQFVVDRVEDEVAFALENAGLPRAAMEARVAEALEQLRLTPLRRRRLSTLSGGEQQRVALAAALALRPEVLVLDEPTSELDPAGAGELLESVVRLREEQGLTVVLAEHRLERLLPLADRLLYLRAAGAPPLVGTLAGVLPHLEQVPPVVALGRRLGWTPLPLTVEEARPHMPHLEPRPPAPPAPGPVRLAAHDLHVALDGHPILKGVSLTLRAGEISVLVGPNGAGKTTLLRALVGLVRPRRGEVRVEGTPIAGRSVAEICRRVGYLPQDPNALLFAETVEEELRVTLQNHGLDAAAAPVAPRALLAELGLAEKAGAYPRDLSAGERQRVALGAILVTQPRTLLLDEPTRGLDAAAKARLASLLERWRAEGRAVLLVTHDVELAARVADRVLLMEGGQITAQGRPAELLTAGSPFAPQLARLLPGAGLLTVEEVLGALTDSPDP
jgi:energy-coupling factor transport system ATP-binding protein